MHRAHAQLQRGLLPEVHSMWQPTPHVVPRDGFRQAQPQLLGTQNPGRAAVGEKPNGAVKSEGRFRLRASGEATGPLLLLATILYSLGTESTEKACKLSHHSVPKGKLLGEQKETG